MIDEVRPETPEKWVECVIHAQSAKNALLSVAGVSPYQMVFGRNPKLPADLLQDNPDLNAIESADSESAMDKAHSIRMAARKAVLEAQDNRALKAAIRGKTKTSSSLSIRGLGLLLENPKME